MCRSFDYVQQVSWPRLSECNWIAVVITSFTHGLINSNMADILKHQVERLCIRFGEVNVSLNDVTIAS